ncbi:hypothetical protein [Kutzneria buriramensis]
MHSHRRRRTSRTILALVAGTMVAFVGPAGPAVAATPHLATSRHVSATTTPVSYRVFATDEGDVGKTTSNMHVIQPNDHFVALPSMAVVSPENSSQYSVRVCGPVRCETAPVWDFGPWNFHDDYWDTSRAEFTDLPQGIPEAQAAYLNGYNGGLDDDGGAPSNPAGIDLADGTFANIGLTDNGWVTVTYLWTSSPTTPPPPPPADRPSATVVDPITHLPDYFVLSNNGGIYQDEQTATGWTGFSPVPGGTGNTGFVSAPAAVAYNGVVEVFAVSGNGSVYQNTRNGSNWTGWDKASLYTGTGNSGFVGTPAAVVDPTTGRPILFVRSGNGSLYQDTLTGTGWSGFAAVGGGSGDSGFGSDPAVVAYGTQKVTVLAVSNNGSVYQNTKTDSSWSGWDKASLYTGSGNSGFVGTPAAVVDPVTGLPIFFVRSGNESLYQDSLTGTGWTGFAAVAGGTGNSGFTTDPGAVAYGNSVDVYAVSSNSSVYHNLKTGSSWSGWNKDSLGAGTGDNGFIGVPAAVADPGTGLPELFVLSTNGSVYVDQNNGAGWNGFGSNALGAGNTGFVAQ